MRAVTLNDYKRRLLPVLVYIQQRLDEPLSLEVLAAMAHFSPFHFHRVFRGMIGESLQEHIRRLRLERAAGQLKHSNRSVTEIAFEAGYESHEAFTRAFKTSFQLTPSRFRSTKTSNSAKAFGQSPSGVHYSMRDNLRNFRAVNSRGSAAVKIESFPPRRVAFVRHTGNYSGCGKAWEELCTWLGKEGMLGGDSVFMGVCHDDPEVTAPEKIRYDACVTVDNQFSAEGGIGVQVLAGGDYAVTTHFGPYEKLSVTYAHVLGCWLPRSGRELRDGPSLEIYHNDPNTTAPEDLVTDVLVPLK